MSNPQSSGSAAESEAVDVSRVPVYPVVRLELSRTADNSVARGTCDGRRVAEGSPAEVRRALLEAAAQVAARRPGHAVRVALVGDELGGPFGVVTATGALIDSAVPTDAGPSRRFRWAAAGVAAALVLGIGGVAGVAIAVSRGWDRPPQTVQSTPSPTPTQIPVPAPAGWGSVAAWSHPVMPGLSQSPIPSATIEGRRLIFAPDSSSGAVAALDEQTGAKVWGSSLTGSTGGQLAGGPAVATMGQRLVVVGWSATDLTAWNAANGEQIGTWPLGAATSVFVSDGRVIATGPTPHAGVLTGTGLEWRVLAAGATAVGATPDGRLIATTQGQAWSTESNAVAGAATPLPAPERASWVGPVGLSQGVLLAAYSRASAGDSTVILRAFGRTDTGWTPLWTSEPVPNAIAPANSSLPLWAADDGSWGVLGSSWVDLRTGAVHPLPADWRTTAVGNAGAFGLTIEGPAFVSSSGAVSAPAAGGDVVDGPRGLTDSGTALIVATDGDAAHLYAVPRDPSGAGPTASSEVGR